jgi:glycosyltransferase involved in cell wall biosynthesis
VNTHFTIVIPSYNSEMWVERNVRSAAQQDYDNFEILYFNDASSDNTGVLAEECFQTHTQGLPTKYKIFHNSENKKALHSINRAVRGSREDTVVVLLDGDDWFPNSNVLSVLNSVYGTNTWITAGSYVDNATYQVTSPVLAEGFWEGNIRHKAWTFSHLRTFRRELFLNINEDDMIDADGQYYKCTFDQVMMYPMVEMAGPEHFKALNDVLYIYNRLNPISVDRVHRHDQLRIESVIRSKKPYSRLAEL